MELTAFRLPEELIRKVNTYSKKMEKSRSYLIRQAIENYLEELEDLEIAYRRMHNPRTKIISSKKLRKRLNV